MSTPMKVASRIIVSLFEHHMKASIIPFLLMPIFLAGLIGGMVFPGILIESFTEKENANLDLPGCLLIIAIIVVPIAMNLGVFGLLIFLFKRQTAWSIWGFSRMVCSLLIILSWVTGFVGGFFVILTS